MAIGTSCKFWPKGKRISRLEIEARESATRLTPLHKAAGNGHHAVVDLLVDRGAKLESNDVGYRTALFWAFKNGYSDRVQLLLEKGANPDYKDGRKEELLLWAARTGHAVITGLAAANLKTDLNAADDNGLTQSLWTAYNQKLVIAKIVLEQGADLEVRDGSSRTPLMWAAFKRDEGLARLLLKKGAVMEAEDKHGRTAFFWAVENSHEKMVKLLLDWTGDHEEREKFMDILFTWAAQTPTNNATSLSLGQNEGLKDKAAPKAGPLLWAVRKSYEGLAQQFIERDIILNQEDLFRQGAIMWSTGYGQKALLELLLGTSEHAQSTDQSNRSLLWAAKHGHAFVVKLLLKEGTDIEAKDSMGYTALLWAAREGHPIIARLLVNHGANIRARTVYRETPLCWAARNGHDTLVNLLLDSGACIESEDKFGLTSLA